MNITEVIQLLDDGKLGALISHGSSNIDREAIIEGQEQYEVDTHDVMDASARPDKVIKKEKSTDPNGLSDGGGIEKIVKVARLPLAYQKKIVEQAVMFLGVPKLKGTVETDQQKDLMARQKELWAKSKMDYKFRQIAKHAMSELQAAELWYPVKLTVTNAIGWKCMVLAPSKGDILTPIFDEFGDMVAFVRRYSISKFGGDGNSKRVDRADVYTDEFTYQYISEANGWVLLENGKKANAINKIPIIYYSKAQTEWHDVEHLIKRLEIKRSNHADTNDYFDSPVLAATGTIKQFADKGESGKLIELESDARLEYITWNGAPESMKMEIENLEKSIHSFTHSADFSLDNIKGFGALSGVVLKMLFMDANMKAADNADLFGESVQRRVNLLNHIISISNPNLKEAAGEADFYPQFTPFTINNDMETIDMLAKAVEAGILSRETAVSLNPVVKDVETELLRIANEKGASNNGSVA